MLILSSSSKLGCHHDSSILLSLRDHRYGMSVKHVEKSMLRNFLAYLEGTSIPKDIPLKREEGSYTNYLGARRSLDVTQTILACQGHYQCWVGIKKKSLKFQVSSQFDFQTENQLFSWLGHFENQLNITEVQIHIHEGYQVNFQS